MLRDVCTINLSPSSNRLGLHPFTVKMSVQSRPGTPFSCYSNEKDFQMNGMGRIVKGPWSHSRDITPDKNISIHTTVLYADKNKLMTQVVMNGANMVSIGIEGRGFHIFIGDYKVNALKDARFGEYLARQVGLNAIECAALQDYLRRVL